MKLTMIANPPTPTHLALLRQLGVEHAVHYDMHGLPDDRAGLLEIKRIYENAGLAWKISESTHRTGIIPSPKPSIAINNSKTGNSNK